MRAILTPECCSITQDDAVNPMQAHPTMIQGMIHQLNQTLNLQRLSAFLMLIAFFCTPTAAQAAQPASENKHFKATAQTSTLAIPGEDALLIIEITVDKDWHTYWPGLNDTGYGLSVTPFPSEHLTFGEPFYPTPTRHLAAGNILDHIYENTFQVLIPYTVSDDAQPGTRFAIGASIDALVCNQICIPESDAISLMLAVINPTDHTFTRQEAIDTYNDRPTDLTSVTPKWTKDTAQLRIPGATHYQFFPSDDCTQPANLIKEGDTKSKVLTITFDRSYEDDPTTPAVLSGRIRAKVLDTWQEFNIHFVQEGSNP